MIRNLNGISILILISICLVLPGIGQVQSDKFFLVGIEAGYSLPVGEWKQHPYAPEVDQFTGDYTIGLSISYKFQRTLGLSLSGFYLKLNTDDWTSYAASQGDNVDASASAQMIFLNLLYFILHHRPQLLSMDIGLGYSSFAGKESFESYQYDYDFLRSGFGIGLGAGYTRFLNDQLGLMVNMKGFIMPSGIQYPDGQQNSVFLFSGTLGIRYVF